MTYRSRTRVCLAAVAVALGACGGTEEALTGSGDPGSGPAPDGAFLDAMGDVMDDPEGDPLEAAAHALEARLATDFIDAANHDSWICRGEGLRVEYRLLMANDGERRGRELDGTGAVTPLAFGWAAIGADTVLLDYPGAGRQIEIASMLFANDDAFRASDSANGPLECRRQRYVDATPMRDLSALDVPADIDPDAGAAVALAARLEARDEAGTTLDFWHCDTADGVSLDYVFAAAGVLAPEPRALELADAMASVTDGRVFRWVVTGGATLVLVPLDADVAGAAGGVERTTLGAIVFPVEGVFTATRTDGGMLQCLRRERRV